ncbi:MAG: metallophosphoesterase family protein [Armatimonadota bacterium]
MKPVRIMHFADSHFGIETYGKVDPETGLNSRLLDFRHSLEYAIEKALDAGVHAALFAGDAYKTRDPSQTHQREFATCIRKLTEAGVPVVMVTGNHDLPNTRSRANSIEIYNTIGVTNVHILSRPQVLTLETAAGPIQIASMPYLLRSNVLSRDECRNKTIQETTDMMVAKYCDYIEYLAGQVNPEIPSVLLGHFWIKNARVSGQNNYLNVAEPEVLVSSVANPAFDYVAMGHIHKFQDLNKRGNPPVVYSGSTDRIDFGERGEDRGFILADIAKGSADYQFVPIPVRPFIEIEVDADVDDPTEKILASISQHDLTGAVVKLRYTISQEKLPLLREQEIKDALSDAFMIVSVNRDVSRDTTAMRNKLLNEALDPVQALEMYFDTKDKYQKRRDELMEYARPLIDELLAEEQVK